MLRALSSQLSESCRVGGPSFFRETVITSSPLGKNCLVTLVIILWSHQHHVTSVILRGRVMQRGLGDCRCFLLHFVFTCSPLAIIIRKVARLKKYIYKEENSIYGYWCQWSVWKVRYPDFTYSNLISSPFILFLIWVSLCRFYSLLIATDDPAVPITMP